jgi:predicted neutral ceramidase superfamily lipid hydrolase
MKAKIIMKSFFVARTVRSEKDYGIATNHIKTKNLLNRYLKVYSGLPRIFLCYFDSFLALTRSSTKSLNIFSRLSHKLSIFFHLLSLYNIITLVYLFLNLRIL